MFSTDSHEQMILEFAQGSYIAISVELFLVDRQASGKSRHTIKSYRQFLNPFTAYCNAHSLTQVQECSFAWP